MHTLLEDGFQEIDEGTAYTVSERIDTYGHTRVEIEVANANGDVIATGVGSHHTPSIAYDRALQDAIDVLQELDVISDYDYYREVADSRYCGW